MLIDKVDSRALLIHRHQETKNIDITTHEVIPVADSGFTLGAGRAMTVADRDQLAAILLDEDRESPFIEEHILVATRAMICWYRKPSVADLPFSYGQTSSIINAPLPGLIFVASAGSPLRCFAYKGKQRPTPNTELFYPPLGNVYHQGNFCSGNTNVSRVLIQSNIPEWERFVLEAASTHMGSITPVKGIKEKSISALAEFLQGLSDSGIKVFPARKLVPLQTEGRHYGDPKVNVTLSAVLRGEAK
jgi:PRTRC genetic system protein B